MEPCKQCSFSQYQRVSDITAHKSKVLVLGDVPQYGGQYNKLNSGASQLIHRTFKTMGIYEVEPKPFITNVLKCIPPKNKVNMNKIDEICFNRIKQITDQVQPDIIITLGNLPLHVVTGNNKLKVTQEQGSTQKCAWDKSINVVPLVNPNSLVHSPGEYLLFQGVVEMAKEILVTGAPPDPGETQWYVVDDDISYRKFLKRLEQISKQELPIVAADMESTGLKRYVNDILITGIAVAKNEVWVVENQYLTEELFKRYDIRWGWQNGKFDLGLFRSHGYNPCLDHDTLLMSYALNEHSGIHGLESLATRLLGAKPYKHKVKELAGNDFSKLSKDDLHERVAVDADYTFQIIQKLLPKINNNPHLAKLYYELLIPATNTLEKIEDNGIKVDKTLLEELQKEYEEELEQINNKIIKMTENLWDPELYKRDTGAKTASDQFNAGSPKQLSWMLYKRLRVKDKKKGSTSKDILQKHCDSLPKGIAKSLIKLILHYRTINKELGTYIKGVKKHINQDGRVRTTFNLHITATGRLSSKEPNIQNQPKRKPRVKDIYVPREGKVFVEVDYKGAELRVLADRSGDDFLKDCFINGRDLHSEVSKELDIPRIRAKAVNFGIPLTA